MNLSTLIILVILVLLTGAIVRVMIRIRSQARDAEDVREDAEVARVPLCVMEAMRRLGKGFSVCRVSG